MSFSAKENSSFSIIGTREVHGASQMSSTDPVVGRPVSASTVLTTLQTNQTDHLNMTEADFTLVVVLLALIAIAVACIFGLGILIIIQVHGRYGLRPQIKLAERPRILVAGSGSTTNPEDGGREALAVAADLHDAPPSIATRIREDFAFLDAIIRLRRAGALVYFQRPLTHTTAAGPSIVDNHIVIDISNDIDTDDRMTPPFQQSALDVAPLSPMVSSGICFDPPTPSALHVEIRPTACCGNPLGASQFSAAHDDGA